MQHAADVADNKDGTYSVSLRPEKAGPFELVLSLEGPPGTPAQNRAYAGMCIAHVAAVDKCSIHGAMAELVAGQPGKLTLARADRSDTSLVVSLLHSLVWGLLASAASLLLEKLLGPGSALSDLPASSRLLHTRRAD